MARVYDPDEPTSWQAEGILRRDFRNCHAGPEEITHKRPRKRKIKWCKGKEGAEHTVEKILNCSWPTTCNKRGTHSSFCYKRFCTTCGIESWRLPNPEDVQIKELAEKWCQEGHLYEWKSTDENPYYERKMCAMCGHRAKGRKSLRRRTA